MAQVPTGAGTSARRRNPPATSRAAGRWRRRSIAWSFLLSAGLRGLHRNRHSVDQIVGRIGDDRIRLADAAQNLDRVSEVAPQRDLSEIDPVLAVHHAHLRPLGLEEDRVAGEHERYGLQREMEVDLGIAARNELALRVWNIHLRQQRPRAYSDRVIRSRDGAGELAAGKG